MSRVVNVNLSASFTGGNDVDPKAYMNALGYFCWWGMNTTRVEINPDSGPDFMGQFYNEDKHLFTMLAHYDRAAGKYSFHS